MQKIISLIIVVVVSLAFVINPAKAEDEGQIYLINSIGDETCMMGLVNFKDKAIGRLWTAIDEIKKIKGVKEVSTLRADPPITRDPDGMHPSKPLGCPLTITRDINVSWNEIQPKAVEVCKKLIFSGQKVVIIKRKE